MPESDQRQFEYQATNEAGEVITGRITADSVLEAAAQLKQRGLIVESIQQVAQESSVQPITRSLRDDQTLPVQSHMEDIFRQRESLIAALTAVQGELPRGRTRREIEHLIGELRGATSGADLARKKAVVDWLPLLVTTSSAPTDRWGDLVTRTKSEFDRRNDRRRAFGYPFVVAAIALVVFLFLCIFLLPAFAELYAEFGLRLPPLTLVIVNASELVNQRPILLLASLACIFALTYGLCRLWTHYALTTRLFGFAVSGDTRSLLAMSSLTGRLADLSDAHLSLSDSLWIAGQGCRHYHFKRVAEQLADAVYDGRAAVGDCAGACYLPKNVVDALDAAPTPNVALLRELSMMYGDRAASRTDWISGALVPTTIIVLGGMIGTIVVGLFLPMIELIRGMT